MFWHSFLFTSYCVLWIILECFIIRGLELTEDDEETEFWYKIKAMIAILNVLAMLLSLSIGWLILYMFVKFSKRQHKETFNEQFLLVFNSDEREFEEV